MPRMRILTAQEQALFDHPPIFNYAERKQFFNLPTSLVDMAHTLRAPSSQIGFLVMCGYFKASKRFFLPHDFHARDIEAVAKQLDLSATLFEPNSYTETTRLRHQKTILNFYGFQLFDTSSEQLVQTEIAAMMRSQLKPKLIFERCLDLLIQNRITLPHAHLLTDMIRVGLKKRRHALANLVSNHLTSDLRLLLDSLFEVNEEKNQYRITLLKKLSQSTKPAKIKESVADFQTLSELYQQFSDIRPLLDLGVEGTRYYAGSVAKSQIFQLTRRTDSDRYVHAIAFITHQVYRLQDNLIDVWLSTVRSFQNTASRVHKEQTFTQRKAAKEKTLNLLDRLDTHVLGIVRQVRKLTDDNNVSDGEKVRQIRLVVGDSAEEALNHIRGDLTQNQSDNPYYDLLETRSLRLQNRLNPPQSGVFSDKW